MVVCLGQTYEQVKRYRIPFFGVDARVSRVLGEVPSRRLRLERCGLFRVARQDGKLLWSYQTDGPIKHAPCFSDEHDVVVVLGHGETVFVFKTDTGDIVRSSV